MGFRVIGTCSRQLGEFSPSRGENTGLNHHLGTCKGQLWTTSQRKKTVNLAFLGSDRFTFVQVAPNRKTGHYRSAFLSIVCFPKKSSTCLSTLPFLLGRYFRPGFLGSFGLHLPGGHEDHPRGAPLASPGIRQLHVARSIEGGQSLTKA